MAVRTTNVQVKQILDNTALTGTQIDSYIVSANALVNAALGTGTDDILTQIEMWLTAHMIASTRERMAASEEAGGAKIEYIGTFGERLDSTPYGQMVRMLDTTGRMAKLGLREIGIIAIKEFEQKPNPHNEIP